MDKGVRGFRFDVVNLISKAAFEDDETGDGRKYYTDGPNIHKYLKELHNMTFGTNAEIITVGEMSSTSIENCYQYAGADTGELSMVFSFHHLKVDFMGNEKWVLVPADFGKLKKIIFEWQTKTRFCRTKDCLLQMPCGLSRYTPGTTDVRPCSGMIPHTPDLHLQTAKSPGSA